MEDADEKEGEAVLGGVRLKQILDSLETGDLLPEADIVCNIVDKLERNLNLAACLIQFANYTQVSSRSIQQMIMMIVRMILKITSWWLKQNTRVPA